MKEIQKFIEYLYEKDTPLTFRFIEEPKPKNRKAQAFPYHKNYRELTKEITQAQEENFGVFFTPNISGKKKPKNEDVKKTYTLFIDIDNSGNPGTFLVPPSAIIEREDRERCHVYWFIKESTDLEKWSLGQKALINYYQSDSSIHDPTRLMRLPETLNFKHEIPLKYEFIELNKNRYDLNEMILKHQDPAELLKIARKRIKKLFNGKKLRDGEGRHKHMIQCAFILNDYNIKEEPYQEEINRINEKYMADPFSLDDLKQFYNAQQYAKGKAGERAIDDALREAEKQERVREALKDWWYIQGPEEFIDINYPEYPKNRANFNAIFSKLTGHVGAAAYIFRYDLIKQAEQWIYEPKAETIIERHNRFFINMWKAPNLEEKDGEPKWFINHINYLFKEEDAAHFISYLAHIVQKPTEKIRHAILIISPNTGTGKSMLAELCKKLFGWTNVSEPSNEIIKEKYNAWAKRCQVAFIHDIDQSDKKSFANTFKPLITDDMLTIREMFKSAYTLDNYLHIITTTNSYVPLIIENTDRRWWVMFSEVKPKKQEYYTGLAGHIQEDSGQVFKYLNEYDISKFVPGQRPVINDAKRELMENSMSDLAVFIKTNIELENEPFDRDLVNLNDLYESLPDKHKNFRSTTNRLSILLKENGAVQLDSRVSVEVYKGKTVKKRYWAVRNQEHWIKEDLAGNIGAVIKSWSQEDNRPIFN